MTIGQTIKLYRTGLGMSQIDLAVEMGVTQAAISSLEHDRTYPSYELFTGLADYFGISLDELAGRR